MTNEQIDRGIKALTELRLSQGRDEVSYNCLEIILEAMEEPVDPDVHYDNCTKQLEPEEKKEPLPCGQDFPISDCMAYCPSQNEDCIGRPSTKPDPIRKVYDRWKDTYEHNGASLSEAGNFIEDMWNAISQYCEA